MRSGRFARRERAPARTTYTDAKAPEWSARRAEAPTHAAMHAHAMLDKGDLDGQKTWKAIIRAIEDIQRGERDVGEPIN